MEWLNKMNDAINYIESRLNEKINVNDVARVACCSTSRFQRMFTFATDISVTEYIRYRRMAIAANELLSSDIKVIDLALKYGYESPEAFTRAFQAFHGISPTSVRKLEMFTNYPRLSFQIQINGGHFNMGKKSLVRIEDHSNERVVSFFVNCKSPESKAGILMRNWVVNNLTDYMARRCFGCAPKGHHPEGEHHQKNEDAGTHEYVVQMILVGDEGVGDTFLGADVCDAPKGLFLVSDISMTEFNDDGTVDIGSSMQTAYGIMSECLKEMGGYEFDFNYGDPLKERRHIEEPIYNKEWWENPDNKDAGSDGFKLWLPIRKL